MEGLYLLHSEGGWEQVRYARTDAVAVAVAVAMMIVIVMVIVVVILCDNNHVS